MRLSSVAFLMILTTLFLSGCASEQVASVEDKGSMKFTRNGVNGKNFYSSPTNTAASVSTVESHDLMAPAKSQNAISYRPVQGNGKSPFGPASKPLAQSTVPYAPVTNSRWQWPVSGKVIQSFGPQRDGIASQGITISANEGAPIHAAQAGVVAYVGQNIRDYGNMVILRHSEGTLTSYAHARNIVVAKGEQVQAGSVIGYVGKSGSAKTPQLHFAVREGSQAIDPIGKLPQTVAYN